MSLLTIRSGGSAHPEDSVLQFLTDVIVTSGVLDLTNSHFEVTERGAGANMSVDVAAGRAIVEGDGNAYPVRNTDVVNKTITSNASGNPRIDSVVLYIDLAASPDSTVTNVAKLTVVAGTPAASPEAPDDTAIGTAIGASNPYVVLANVTVANAASTIEDADISDQRAMFKTVEGFQSIDLSYGASIEIDLGTRYKQFRITPTGNFALTLKNYREDRPFSVRIKQDPGGGRSVSSWFSGYTINWPGGAAPTLSSDPNAIDTIGFIPQGNNILDAYLLGLGLS